MRWTVGWRLPHFKGVAVMGLWCRENMVPLNVSNPRAHRVRQCLVYIANHPGASNREVASGIGVNHQSQISYLLGALVKVDLVSKTSDGVGKRNAWWLTPHGEVALLAFPTDG